MFMIDDKLIQAVDDSGSIFDDKEGDGDTENQKSADVSVDGEIGDESLSPSK